MKQRKQAGSIWLVNDKWYVRYAERRIVDGVVKRQRVLKFLADKDKGMRGKEPPQKILDAAEKMVDAAVNNCSVPTGQLVNLVDFAEKVFFPAIEKRLKKSTVKNYKLDWALRLKPLVKDDGTALKNYRTVNVQQWMDSIAKDRTLSKSSLKGFKSFMSSLFKEAKRLGYCDGNPVVGVLVDPTARGPEDTYAYSLEEIETLLSLLPEPASTIFAIAAYSGLRRGEIEGLKWENYRDGHLHVEFSVWSGKVGTPKSKSSRAAVPVIPLLAERLELHRKRVGNPTKGWIFNTSNNTPLSTHNVVNRVILPTLNVCRHCGQTEDDHLPHLLGEKKACDGYERDECRPEWHGFHAGRRGLGSNLYRLGVPEKIIQKILRHSDVSTTTTYYVKTNDADSSAAMKKLEAEVARLRAALQASRRPIESETAETAVTVN